MVLPDEKCDLSIVRYNYVNLENRRVKPICIDWPQEILDKWKRERQRAQVGYVVIMLSTLRRKLNESRTHKRPRATRNSDQG